jgi:hypothetical protein
VRAGSMSGSVSGWAKRSSVPIWSAQEQLKIWFWYAMIGLHVWRAKIWIRSRVRESSALSSGVKASMGWFGSSSSCDGSLDLSG